MRMPLREAKRDAELDIHRIESAVENEPIRPPQTTIEPEEIIPIDTSTDQPRVKAWSPQLIKHDPGRAQSKIVKSCLLFVDVL